MMQTDDIFLGAFALVRGGDLARVEVRGVNGRRIAFFYIEGEDMKQVERDYYGGPAVGVNLLLLKSSVRRLKDAAFYAIREEERRSHAPAEDQPGTDREHQVADRLRRARR
jgi:hypothetical protein